MVSVLSSLGGDNTCTVTIGVACVTPLAEPVDGVLSAADAVVVLVLVAVVVFIEILAGGLGLGVKPGAKVGAPDGPGTISVPCMVLVVTESSLPSNGREAILRGARPCTSWRHDVMLQCLLSRGK